MPSIIVAVTILAVLWDDPRFGLTIPQALGCIALAALYVLVRGGWSRRSSSASTPS